MANVMLTTIDNPWNPFTHFDEWLAFDEEQARIENRPTCCCYLARMSKDSDDVSDEELEEQLEDTINDICEVNLTGKFLKITEEEAKSLQ